MYLRYMAIAFLTNGLGVFGLRILSGAGLGNIDPVQYLSMWYLSGAAVALGVYLWRYRSAHLREIVIGGSMALCSLFGQIGMALSLTSGLPGVVVFPVATGGGLLLVMAVGLRFFHERLRAPGYLGMITGTAALILLALP
jgi:multidrug transporter EmrE-like cation transporter